MVEPPVHRVPHASVVALRGRYEIHREMSTTAATKFADGSLDFVYLDARYSYSGCMSDILAWFPKVSWTIDRCRTSARLVCCLRVSGLTVSA